MQPPPNEQDLITQAQKGDEEAVTLLYETHVDAIYQYICYRVDSKSTAEDLTSEVFLRMVRGLARYQDQGVPFRADLTPVWRTVKMSVRLSVRSNCLACAKCLVSRKVCKGVRPKQYFPVCVRSRLYRSIHSSKSVCNSSRVAAGSFNRAKHLLCCH